MCIYKKFLTIHLVIANYSFFEKPYLELKDLFCRSAVFLELRLKNDSALNTSEFYFNSVSHRLAHVNNVSTKRSVHLRKIYKSRYSYVF